MTILTIAAELIYLVFYRFTLNYRSEFKRWQITRP